MSTRVLPCLDLAVLAAVAGHLTFCACFELLVGGRIRAAQGAAKFQSLKGAQALLASFTTSSAASSAALLFLGASRSSAAARH